MPNQKVVRMARPTIPIVVHDHPASLIVSGKYYRSPSSSPRLLPITQPWRTPCTPLRQEANGSAVNRLETVAFVFGNRRHRFVAGPAGGLAGSISRPGNRQPAFVARLSGGLVCAARVQVAPLNGGGRQRPNKLLVTQSPGRFALGLVTPGRLGELGRCVFVRQPERAQVALLTVFDRALDFWALLTSMGAAYSWWFPARPRFSEWRCGWPCSPS